MTIESYYLKRRMLPLVYDSKESKTKSSTTTSFTSNNLIDEDQLARTFQEIVNCINLDDDEGEDESEDIAVSKINPINPFDNNFHIHHPLLPDYESIFSGTKGTFNIAVGSTQSPSPSTTGNLLSNHAAVHVNSNSNNSLGKSFLDDDWFPGSKSSNNNNNNNANRPPPGYPKSSLSSRPVTPSPSVTSNNGNGSPSSSSSSSSNSNDSFNRVFPNSGTTFGNPFNNHPPIDYICKLCNCGGHWMKDCKLYEQRTPTSSISSFKSTSSSSGSTTISSGSYGITSSQSQWRTFLPPGNYVCRLCNVSGHWIDQCSKFQPKHHLEESNSNGPFQQQSQSQSESQQQGSHHQISTSLPLMLGPGPTPNSRPPAYLSKPVPSNYICNLCNRPGHWIQQCTEFTPIINHKPVVRQ